MAKELLNYMSSYKWVILLLFVFFTVTQVNAWCGEWSSEPGRSLQPGDKNSGSGDNGNGLSESENSVFAKELHRILREILIPNSPIPEKKKTPFKQLTTTALSYLGVPYQWRGITKTGFDCSGFIWRVFQKHGVILPGTRDLQYAFGINIR